MNNYCIPVKVSHLLEEKAKLSASKVSGPSNEKVKSSTKGDSLLPKSDATLNCPACMVTLCIDCQRYAFNANGSIIIIQFIQRYNL